MTVCKKVDIEHALKSLPETTTVEEAMERLYFLASVEKGLAQANAGETISHDEVKQRLKQWL